MAEQSFTNTADALKAIAANLSPRQIELENLERYALGTQYQGLPDWFSDDVPLWERAPCIVYKMTAAAIRSNCSLVLGKGHAPTISANPGEDDSDVEGLDKEASKRVDRALKQLLGRVRFWSVARQALKHAQQSKSVAVIAGARAGRPFLELVRSRWCEPAFDIHGKVTRLEIRYPYAQPDRQRDGKWKLLPRIYRRVIDEESDTTYLPVDARADGVEPPETAWRPDPARTVKHSLGFCPVHWYAHMADCSTVAEYDGHAIHEDALDEIRALDFALSQRHRAVLFCGDPQVVETGVDPGYNPSGASGRTAMVAATAMGGAASNANPVTGGYISRSGPKAARVKSPGGVWQYEDPNTKVMYLVLPDGSIKPLEEHAADLRNKIAETLAVVILDPTNMKFHGEMSGKAIEQIRAMQFDRCDEIADDVGANLLLPVVNLLLRVALATDVQLPAVKAVAGDLEAYVADDGAAPELYLHWPASYTKPDEKDEQAIVQYVVAARSAPQPVITKRMALERLSRIFAIGNIDQALEELEAEAEADQANALEQAQATLTKTAASPGAADDEPPDTSEAA
jgi:hypothetical protein